MAWSAIESLGKDWSTWVREGERHPHTPTQWASFLLRSRLNYWLYHTTLFLSDVAFYATLGYQRLLYLFTRRHEGGMEVAMDAALKEVMARYGLTVNGDVFDA